MYVLTIQCSSFQAFEERLNCMKTTEDLKNQRTKYRRVEFTGITEENILAARKQYDTLKARLFKCQMLVDHPLQDMISYLKPQDVST